VCFLNSVNINFDSMCMHPRACWRSPGITAIMAVTSLTAITAMTTLMTATVATCLIFLYRFHNLSLLMGTRRGRAGTGSATGGLSTPGIPASPPARPPGQVVLEALRAAHRQRRHCVVFAFSGAGNVLVCELAPDRDGVGALPGPPRGWRCASVPNVFRFPGQGKSPRGEKNNR